MHDSVSDFRPSLSRYTCAYSGFQICTTVLWASFLHASPSSNVCHSWHAPCRPRFTLTKPGGTIGRKVCILLYPLVIGWTPDQNGTIKATQSKLPLPLRQHRVLDSPCRPNDRPPTVSSAGFGPATNNSLVTGLLQREMPLVRTHSQLDKLLGREPIWPSPARSANGPRKQLKGPRHIHHHTHAHARIDFRPPLSTGRACWADG